MGFPKHLLPVPSTGKPLYQHLVSLIHVAFPEVEMIHMSVAGTSKTDNALDQGELHLSNVGGDNRLQLVKIMDSTTLEIGPSAGLLAAHRHDSHASWLVVACDFPLLEPAALHQLKDARRDPVTCFVNKYGFNEPLLSIWTPQALQTLSENVKAGRSGPNFTIKHLNGTLISPDKDDWILNTNTLEEWEAAKWRIKSLHSMDGV